MSPAVSVGYEATFSSCTATQFNAYGAQGGYDCLGLEPPTVVFEYVGPFLPNFARSLARSLLVAWPTYCSNCGTRS